MFRHELSPHNRDEVLRSYNLSPCANGYPEPSPLVRYCASSTRATGLAAASIRRAVAEFVLRVCAANATLISTIIIGLKAFRTLSRNQKLLPHFCEEAPTV